MDQNQKEKPNAGSNDAFNDVRYYSGNMGKHLTWSSTIRGVIKSFFYATIIAVVAWKFSSHLSSATEEMDEFDRVFDEIENKKGERINQFVTEQELKREIEKTVNQTILDSLKDPNVPVEQNDDDSTRSPKKIGGIYVSYLELRTDSMHRLKNKMKTENKKADLSFFNEITKFGYSENNFKEGKDCEIEGKQLECIPYKCTCKNGSKVQQEQCLKSGESCADCEEFFSLAESTLSSSLKEKNQKAKPKTCKKNKCKCENENGKEIGKPADDCTKKELEGNKCSQCYNEYFFISARQICQANECTCTNGTPKTASDCQNSENQTKQDKEQCEFCNEGYDKDKKDKKCVPNSCTCKFTDDKELNDETWKTEKEKESGKENETKICKKKDSDQCLESHCQENGAKYKFNPTTSQCDLSCLHGEEVDEKGVCKKCKPGHYMTEEEKVCKPWLSCDPSNACPGGKPRNGKECNSETTSEYDVSRNCERNECQENTHEELNYLLCKEPSSRSIKVIQKLKVDKGANCKKSFGQSWTETKIYMCRENKCICVNGAVSKDPCEDHGTSLCDPSRCKAGYHDFSAECVKNECTCDNGTPNSVENHNQDQCEKDGDESCYSCNDGYTINDLDKKCVKAKPDEPLTYFHTGAPLPTKKLKDCQDRGDCQDPGAIYCDHKDGKTLIKAVKLDSSIDSDCQPVVCKCFVGVAQTKADKCKYPKYDSTEVMTEKCHQDKCNTDYYYFSSYGGHEICEHTAGNDKWPVSRRILNLNQEDLKKGKRIYEFSQTNPDYDCDNWTEWEGYSEEKFSHFDLRENFCRNPDGDSEKKLWCLKKGEQAKIECYSLATEISDKIKEKEEGTDYDNDYPVNYDDDY